MNFACVSHCLRNWITFTWLAFTWLALDAAMMSRATAQELPGNFAYVRAVDPTIVQDIRYAGANNFVGRPLPGYGAAECILRREAATALKRVQADLAAAGLSAEGVRLLPPYASRARHGGLGA